MWYLDKVYEYEIENFVDQHFEKPCNERWIHDCYKMLTSLKCSHPLVFHHQLFQIPGIANCFFKIMCSLVPVVNSRKFSTFTRGYISKYHVYVRIALLAASKWKLWDAMPVCAWWSTAALAAMNNACFFAIYVKILQIPYIISSTMAYLCLFSLSKVSCFVSLRLNQSSPYLLFLYPSSNVIFRNISRDFFYKQSHF